jgi:hypothetical protein
MRPWRINMTILKKLAFGDVVFGMATSAVADDLTI